MLKQIQVQHVQLMKARPHNVLLRSSSYLLLTYWSYTDIRQCIRFNWPYIHAMTLMK